MIYEVVSGQILLSERERFMHLHGDLLLPMMRQVGISPILLLITEVGRYGRFLDIYAYENMTEYDQKTSELLRLDGIEPYYREVGTCIDGGISVELMREFPYSSAWKQ